MSYIDQLVNVSLARMETTLIRYGLETYQDVIDFNHADEHGKAILSQLFDAYTETPSQSYYTYQGCWKSEEEFAADLVNEIGILESDWSNYFDYDKWTNDLFERDYSSLDCKKCDEIMIVRYE